MADLSALDETLLHQTADPFGVVSTSDHRFFDRTWFGAYAPDGGVGVITGVGAYPNMNVLDGFVAVLRRGCQYNVRVSRPLRPAIDVAGAGPLRHDVVEPLREVRLTLAAGDHPVAMDLTWRGTHPAHVEPRHLASLDGRVYQDYTRFDQPGTVRGWIDVQGERVAVDGWFGARDHSWGVRRSVGGFEPFTGSLPPELGGVLFVWLEFATPYVSGHLQFEEDGRGRRRSLEGFVLDGGASVPVVEVAHDITFTGGSRAYERVALHATTADGRTWDLTAEPLLPAWAYRGTGYDGGFADGKGLGVFRGDLVEHDVYEIGAGDDVRLPDGSIVRPLHREQGVRLTVNGSNGFGHLPVMPIGRIERYGLGV